MRSALLRRGATLVAVSALSVTVLGVTSTPANAHPAGDRATDAGAAWLKGELQGGFLVGDFGPSYGPSIDVALTLVEVNDLAGAKIVDAALKPEIGNYISGGEFDPGSTYAGATAKAATFATVVGSNPASYGGVDLVSRLEGTVSAIAPTAGRIADVSTFGDYANVIGQSFAARALRTAGSTRAGDASAFLLDQQCAEGFFRADLTTDTSAVEQGCVSGAADSAPDVDTTALAVANILGTPGVSPTETAAAQSAAAWLVTQQAADGSFGAGTGLGTNANSTGLAARALAKAGQAAAATKAAAWLRGVQIADLAPCATTLAADNGAIAPKPEALTAARTAGAIPAGQRLSYAFATAQALPALANVPAGTGPLAITAPTTAVEKSTVTVTVAGLGAGEAGCVSFGSVAKPVVGTGVDVTVQFDLPAGVATNTFTLTTLAGSQTAVTSSTPTPIPAHVPAPTPTPAPEVGVLKASKVETAKRNRFTLAVTCGGALACDGRIVVRTTRKVTVGNAGKARKVLVAKKSYTVEPGETEKVVLKVRKPARTVLADGRTKVKAVQTAAGADASVTKFWLRSK